MYFLKLLCLYIISLIAFLAIDFAWLGIVAKNFYQKELAHLLAQNVNWIAAFICYALLIVGILIFAVLPGLEKKCFLKSLYLGILFGFFIYAIYDFTNLATLKNWPIKIVIIDILWGMFITGIVASFGYYVGSHFLYLHQT